MPDVGLEEVDGIVAERQAEPDFAAVAQRAGEKDDRKERRWAGAEHARGDHEELEGHRERNERGDEDGDEPVADEPVAELLRAGGSGGFIEETLAAFARGKEEDHGADGGTEHRKQGREPRVLRRLDSEKDDESVDALSDGDAGGIDQGQREHAQRTEGDQRTGQGFEQF